MTEHTNCPNCNEPLKSGWMSNSLLDKIETKLINRMLEKAADAYCDKCGKELRKEAITKYRNLIDQLEQYLKKNIKHIPILTTHLPYGWEYESCSIVTGQSVTGTGAISEFKSDFSDFFGGQSGSFNKKLAAGEARCFSQLRAKALKVDANAIIATDIDYGEAGASKGMLMVCAAGTAVRVINKEVFGANMEIIEKLHETKKELEELSNYKSIITF
jgi:uncharacterized protein YbjQ (UPF0145 family)